MLLSVKSSSRSRSRSRGRVAAASGSDRGSRSGSGAAAAAAATVAGAAAVAAAAASIPLASPSQSGPATSSGTGSGAAAAAAAAPAASIPLASIPQSGPATIVDTAFSGSLVGDNVGSGLFVLFDQHHSTGQSYRYHARILDIAVLRPESEQPSGSLLASVLELQKDPRLVNDDETGELTGYMDTVDPDGRIWQKLLDIKQMNPRHVRNQAWQALLSEQQSDDKIVEFLQMCKRMGFVNVD